jgi:hypothetical protein
MSKKRWFLSTHYQQEKSQTFGKQFVTMFSAGFNALSMRLRPCKFLVTRYAHKLASFFRKIARGCQSQK